MPYWVIVALVTIVFAELSFSSWYLLQGGHFSGIYRKVQLKPQGWVKVIKDGEGTEEERPTEALMLLKYGGVLTHAGRKQVQKKPTLYQ